MRQRLALLLLPVLLAACASAPRGATSGGVDREPERSDRDARAGRPVQLDEEIDRADATWWRRRFHVLGKAGCQRLPHQERVQLTTLRRVVGERQPLGLRLEEEIERIVDRRLRHQVDFDPHRVHALGKRQTGNVIALGILLPVDEVERRLHEQRIGKDRCATVGSRTQPYELGRQMDEAIVPVFGEVMQGNVYRHRPSMLAAFRARRS